MSFLLDFVNYIQREKRGRKREGQEKHLKRAKNVEGKDEDDGEKKESGGKGKEGENRKGKGGGAKGKGKKQQEGPMGGLLDQRQLKSVVFTLHPEVIGRVFLLTNS